MANIGADWSESSCLTRYLVFSYIPLSQAAKFSAVCLVSPGRAHARFPLFTYFVS